MTHDIGHMVGDEHSLKISAPKLLRFGIESVLKILHEGMNELITKLLIEQPRLHQAWYLLYRWYFLMKLVLE